MADLIPPPAGREDPDVETASEDYAGRFAGPVGAWFLDLQARVTLDLLRPYPGARILEVGGGHAQLAGPLSQAGYRVTVTGSSPACRERLDRLLPPGAVDLVVCDLLELPWEEASFDLVLAFRLLPHLEGWQRLLAEMARVARRGVIVDYPELISFNLLSQGLFAAKKAVEKNTRPFTCFRTREVKQVLAAQGLDFFARKAQFFLPMALHRALGAAPLSRGMEAVCRGLGLTALAGSPVILKAERGGGPA